MMSIDDKYKKMKVTITMTITMTMTYEDEEQLILNHVISARAQVAHVKGEIEKKKRVLAELEQFQKNQEQALIDFYKSTGVTESDHGDYKISYRKSKSVDAPDIDAVPEKYIRTKVTKSVDKQAIRRDKLEPNNWFQYKETDTLVIKHKDA